MLRITDFKDATGEVTTLESKNVKLTREEELQAKNLRLRPERLQFCSSWLIEHYFITPSEAMEYAIEWVDYLESSEENRKLYNYGNLPNFMSSKTVVKKRL